MEGFLFKKGKKESTFGRRNWKRRWFTLDGVDLTYYEGFDTEKGKPTEMKGVIEIKLGCQVACVDHRDKKFVFSVENPGSSPFYLSAESERMMKIWLAALKQASSGDCFGRNYREYYELLGLSELDDPSVAVINRAYRKAALKAHPDKGGDITQFKKIQEAFEMLVSKVEEEEQDKLYDEINFDATIQKGGQGVGFGMIVVEDPKKGFIYVKEILPTMRLQYLGDAANGALHPNDKLIAVEADDITTWTLARVIQRLNDFRVPVNSSVKLVFSRKVRKTEDQLAENDESENDDIDVTDTRTPSFHQEATEDVDEEEEEVEDVDENFEQHHPQQQQQHQQQHQNQQHHHDPEEHRKRKNSKDSTPDPEQLLTLLKQSEANVGTLKEAVNHFRKNVKQLEKELKNTKSELKRSKQKELKLSEKLRLLESQKQVSTEQLYQSRNNANTVAVLLQSGQQLPVSDELERTLEKMGLKSESQTDSGEAVAVRQAHLAAAAVDPSGTILERWAASGQSAADRLRSLEQRLNAESINISSGRNMDRHDEFPSSNDRDDDKLDYIPNYPIDSGTSQAEEYNPQQQGVNSSASSVSSRSNFPTDSNKRNSPSKPAVGTSVGSTKKFPPPSPRNSLKLNQPVSGSVDTSGSNSPSKVGNILDRRLNSSNSLRGLVNSSGTSGVPSSSSSRGYMAHTLSSKSIVSKPNIVTTPE